MSFKSLFYFFTPYFCVLSTLSPIYVDISQIVLSISFGTFNNSIQQYNLYIRKFNESFDRGQFTSYGTRIITINKHRGKPLTEANYELKLEFILENGTKFDSEALRITVEMPIDPRLSSIGIMRNGQSYNLVIKTVKQNGLPRISSNGIIYTKIVQTRPNNTQSTIWQKLTIDRIMNYKELHNNKESIIKIKVSVFHSFSFDQCNTGKNILLNKNEEQKSSTIAILSPRSRTYNFRLKTTSEVNLYINGQLLVPYLFQKTEALISYFEFPMTANEFYIMEVKDNNSNDATIEWDITGNYSRIECPFLWPLILIGSTHQIISDFDAENLKSQHRILGSLVCSDDTPYKLNNACIKCGPGTVITNDTTCEACPAGQHPNANRNGCISCEANKHSVLNQDDCKACTAGNQVNLAKNGCVKCAQGTFNSNGEGVCKECAAGQHPNSDRTDCEPCGDGKYSISGQDSCGNCPAGHIIKAGEANCHPCTAGTHANELHTGCVHCAIGLVSTLGQQACKKCDAGKYGDSNGINCDFCKIGTVRKATEETCTPCPAGTHAKADHTSCVSCEKGTIIEIGKDECIKCIAGKYASADDTKCISCKSGMVSTEKSDACTACEKGTYPDENHVICKPCPEGSVSEKGQEICIECADGKQPSADKSKCETCPAGSVSKKGSACTLCLAGTYSNAQGTECVECPYGTYNPLKGSASEKACTACSTGYYTESKAKTKEVDCVPCPEGTHISSDKSKCEDCLIGTSSIGPQEICSPCAAGSVSLGKQKECTICSAGTYASTDKSV